METNIELKGELGIVDSRPPTEEIKPPPGESQPSTERVVLLRSAHQRRIQRGQMSNLNK
ncbi:hypothetical protein [Enterococcus sp. 1001283B150225_161107_E12]|uniref:hypothetical protein n=1 Tax=Enterococcus sp. 1001283B150225_161107_E12 TaxID=2787145 RepID=UPI0018A09317|nr:hypothetical protein [Enterococcus sp. 1001283B150225_161107_E12]